MAAAQPQRHGGSRVLVMVDDPKELRSLIYKLDLEHLFSGEPNDDEFPPVLSFPDPVGCFRHLDRGEEMRMRIASSGNLVVAATTEGRTLLCDTDANDLLASSGPDRRSTEDFQSLLSVGDDMFFSMGNMPRMVRTGGRRFELLLRLPDDGRWAWRPVPDPPGLSGKPDITGFFVDPASTCVWVSFKDQGTFSFDAVRRRWRREGAWVLPFNGLSVLATDSGRKLLFGICMPSCREYRFAACDMEARPPAIMKSWDLAEICPSTQPKAWPRTYVGVYNTVEPAYLGGGRFCISMLTQITPEGRPRAKYGTDVPNPRLLTLTAVEVTPELQLIKRKFSCYSMPLYSLAAWAL